ncbi:3-keto-5-aminohexanoate cleavage protein [Streptomyces anandii]|uniref:3-keto-5-aminohexanoate cleavage protein n=1 Tax=Streptomyces anandii TaxID=285454 RepID=UPI0036FE75C0
MVRVCLNGSRWAADGAVVPLTPAALAQSAAGAVAAGATEVDVRPRTPCGRESLSPRVIAATLEAIRARVTVPVGVTTPARAEPGPAADGRARMHDWTVLPDFACVDWGEPGAEELTALLLDLGVEAEAAVRSGTDAASRFAASPLGPSVRRVVVKVTDVSAVTVEQSAYALLTALGDVHGRPLLLHGQEATAWPVLRLAGRLGLATRTGLEDTLHLPDGRRARSNAELLTAALREHADAGRA